MLISLALAAALLQEPPSWSDVAAILNKHCVSCHGPKEAKGELRVDSHAALLKGGDAGEAVTPGKAHESFLIKLVEHRKKPPMPPPNKGKKLADAEIAVLRAWIAAGAPGPRAGEGARAVEIPKIVPKVAPRRAVHALAWDPKSGLLAAARPGGVDLVDPRTHAVVRTFGTPGTANDLAFSADGRLLAVAGGEPGVSGAVHLWDAAGTGTAPPVVLQGHADAVYSLALSPDGRLLATGGYDREILLWDLATRKPVRTLRGHNEAVFDLAFRPDGKILASASADRTLKLWDVESGQRRDTLTESTKALHAATWTPDGRHVLAGGVDNRIRAWEVSADAKEGTNPIRASVFAHEGALLAIRVSADGKTLLSSADDRTVKLFDAADYAPRLVLEVQPDWPAAVGFALGDRQVAVGRLDGTIAFYDVATGKLAAIPKPETSALAPRGLRRGSEAEFRVSGKNLGALGAVRTGHPKLAGKVLQAGQADRARISLAAAPELPPGGYDVWVSGPGGEAGPLRVWIDELPQVSERESAAALSLPSPSSAWGALSSPGDTDLFSVEARKGETLVLDLAAKRLGSKLEAVLTLSDPSGRLVASNIDFEGEADPLVAYEVPADGVFSVRVGDLQYGFSPDHFYRLSVGRLPVVTGVHPLAIPANRESEVFLAGHNLPPGASVRVRAGAPGEVAVPIDPDRFRARRDLKVLATAAAEILEAEPNDRPGQATPLVSPGGANGRIGAPGDVDLYRLDARRGVALVIETLASRRGSPADTKIEVLHPDGRPVPRVLLRAVRDSWLEFRPIDANAIGGRFWKWEEMDLNQLLYLQGEVVKLFLAPRGPDSQWDFFSLNGKRVTYFDTSATAHALDAPAYIVEAHPPGTQLPANGLPTFTLPTENDDDGLRQLGSDSLLRFEPPADGAYLVRVSDVRGHGGERHAYRLSVREARPDVAVRLEGLQPAIPAGSGRQFTVRVDRIDGFEGPVRVDVEGLPPGFLATNPVTIEAGHFFSQATVWAAADAPKPTRENASSSKAVARARIGGREVLKPLPGLGTLSIAEAPKVRVRLEPADGAPSISVAPGRETAAVVRIERNGFDDRVTFDVEGLPFGVIVSDIGLNGVLIPEKETERRIFLQCAPWVAPQTRPCHARAREVGNPSSAPVPFTVLDPKTAR
jgi:hypothetical protein